MSFVGKDPHQATMGTLRSYMGETVFTRWTIRGSDVPPSRDDAMRRSDSPPTN